MVDTVICGDNLEVMRGMDENSIDSIITDPPYGLGFMGKGWDTFKPEYIDEVMSKDKRPHTKIASQRRSNTAGKYDHSRNAQFQAWCTVWAKECLRVAKPGAILMAFGGTRTFHRLTCAIEDAGWEIRDCIQWIYGSGFPKSLDISKAIDKAAEAEREVVGIEHRPEGRAFAEGSSGFAKGDVNITAPTTPLAQQWNGWGTALKPSWEPIIVAMKPLDGTFAQNAEKWGVAGLWIDGGRIEYQSDADKKSAVWGRGTDIMGGNYVGATHGTGQTNIQPDGKGRFPANTILDEDFIPILCLTDTGRFGTMQAIKEYYYDYGLPAMRQRIQDFSESGKTRAAQVLQQEMLSQGTIKEDDGDGASDVRQETQARVNSQNEKEASEDREKPPDIQGVVYGEGLSACQSSGIESVRTGNGKADDNAGFHTGTSACDGDETGQSVEAVRASTSPERNQRRQQVGKPRSPDQLDTQDEPQTNSTGTAGAKKRERRIEVLACDIPECWLKYFKPTGYEIRDPNCAAAMLDEQSGELKSGGIGSRVQTKAGMYGGGKHSGTDNGNDSGGASRFFYCAKSSKAERNAGCEGLEAKVKDAEYRQPTGNAMVDRIHGCGKERQNHHPTIKPLALMEYLCKLTKTPTGGIVLDPFAGSGTTGIAAYKTGRQYILIEKEPDYCKIAEKRIQDERDKYALFSEHHRG